ncbi:MAG TPA: UDP-N-acetylmuramoyl-tripeptide--D-alanyl-D-alanine ligase [Coriobacteriia bacterium]|nr:UDP-N-acetylmuramoyl-tripeptide--D-alanyl-D-alanine ligase [Coriobacteriia bacterium]
MLTLSVGTLLEITGGDLLAGPSVTMVNGCAIDSRQIQPGGAFVAFIGEHADGHVFVGDALERGARALIVTRDDVALRSALETAGRPEVALILVDDALGALEALASWHRGRLMCPVMGITGSTGKTTTKDFLRSILATRLRVVATEGNRNNELGVPLTIMDAGTETEALIVEMAMRGIGQIDHLCSIARPTAGLVTNVGVSHIEVLGSEEAIAAAKGELVRAVPADGRVFLNGDDAWSDMLAAGTDATVTRYGLGPAADVSALDVTVSDDGHPAFTLVCAAGTVEVRLPTPGRHNVYNALAAAAVALYLDLSLDDIVAGLERATFSRWRMETFESASGVVVINDAYNANPTSMSAAISALGDVPSAGRRIAVLGDMAELGSLTELAHFQLGGEVAASSVDVLVTVGERARRIAEGARAAGLDPAAVRPCATADEASEVLDDLLAPGDTVLVKASRVMGLEAVVEGIMEPRVQPSA